MDEKSLIAALRKAEAEKYAEVPSEDEIEHAFSDTFRHKMNRLIRLQRQSVWNMINTPLRRSLLLLLILLLTFGVPPEKNPLFRIIQPIPQLSTVVPIVPDVSLPQNPTVLPPKQTQPEQTEQSRSQETDPVKPNAAQQPEERSYLPQETGETPVQEEISTLPPEAAHQPAVSHTYADEPEATAVFPAEESNGTQAYGTANEKDALAIAAESVRESLYGTAYNTNSVSGDTGPASDPPDSTEKPTTMRYDSPFYLVPGVPKSLQTPQPDEPASTYEP